MASIVIAKDGDTLCGIGMRSGFLDCATLRAEAANASLLSRALIAGDRVTVPNVRPRTASAATATSHTYVRPRWPEPVIRLVHGSPNLPAHRDASLSHLGISNYHTEKAGTTGTASFSNAYGFNADADADPDTFKVEVLSPDGGGSIKVTLEALKPVYAADGSVSKHELFTGAAYSARRLEADCQLVQGSTKRYRSRYLRLVVDETETARLPDQTLLVTDMADGLNGDADRVEILDQRVRVSYPLPRCPVAGVDRCTVRCELPVGKDPQRIRMAIHVYRDASGVPVGGLTEQMVRKRVGKWFRRLYAQANLAPTLVDPVEFLDSPQANMIVIGQDGGQLTSGRTAAGTTSTIAFELLTLTGTSARGPDPVSFTLSALMTPSQVGAAICSHLPAGYSGQSFTNPRSFTAFNSSCDVLITDASGGRVRVRGLRTTDTSLLGHLDPGVVNLNMVHTPTNLATLVSMPMDMRRILRDGTSSDDRIDFYIVGGVQGARGVAVPPAQDIKSPYAPQPPLRWAAILGMVAMDASDNNPFSFPHEAGHVLLDVFHADQRTAVGKFELMAGGGTTSTSTPDATRHISQSPVQVTYGMFNPNQTIPGSTINTLIDPQSRLQTRGAAVFRGW